ncbi:MAG: hypothetical protein FGM15_10360 [Chthoniobacterales bacterium]|nr:hypothetical protein [Chthoniobacterales bacterium]
MNSERNNSSDNEVLVRVEGVSKKFCRSLKKSLWYGVCDIAGELNPLAKRGGGRTEVGSRRSEASRQGLEGEGKPLDILQNVHVSSEEGGGAEFKCQGSEGEVPSNSESLRGGERGEGLRPGEFWAVNDVSFELRRGEPGGDGAARRIGEANPKGAMSGSERINASG